MRKKREQLALEKEREYWDPLRNSTLNMVTRLLRRLFVRILSAIYNVLTGVQVVWETRGALSRCLSSSRRVSIGAEGCFGRERVRIIFVSYLGLV